MISSDHRPPFLRASLHFQKLDALRQNHLAVHALGRHVTDLTVGGVQLVQALNGTPRAVANPVIFEITESNRQRTRCGGRNIGRGVNLIAQQPVRFSCLDGRLPQIHAVAVLQLAEQGNSRVVHQELCISAIRGLERVHKADHLIHRDCGRACRRHADRAALRRENARGLVRPGAYAERFLLGDTKSSRKLLHKVVLDIESGILQKLHTDAAQVGQFESINLLLTKRRIALGVRCVLRRPLRGGVTGRDGNLALMLCGDYLGKGADHVFLIKRAHDIALKILRHEETAVRVHALGKDVVQECSAAKVAVEVLLIRIGSTPHFLRLQPSAFVRRLGNRRVHGLVQFRLDGVPAFHALDLVGHSVKVAFHLRVGRVILGGQNAHVVAVGVEKALHGVPERRPLVSHFSDRHGKKSSLKQFLIQCRPQFIHGAASWFLLRLCGNFIDKGAFYRRSGELVALIARRRFALTVRQNAVREI